MSVLHKLASVQGRKDEEPNKALGRELVQALNLAGIEEIADNLWNPDPRIQSDCDGVMEEIGRQAPELIDPYVFDFLKLLSHKRNRRVWQAMICLSLIAERKPDLIFKHRAEIFQAMEKGSVITQDNGIKTLAKVAAAEAAYSQVIFPILLDQLRSCRSKSVPQYAESIFCALTPQNKEQYQEILAQRLAELSLPQQKRVQKVLKKLM